MYLNNENRLLFLEELEVSVSREVYLKLRELLNGFWPNEEESEEDEEDVEDEEEDEFDEHEWIDKEESCNEGIKNKKFIEIPLELKKKTILKLSLRAHENNLTLNEYINKILLLQYNEIRKEKEQE